MSKQNTVLAVPYNLQAMKKVFITGSGDGLGFMAAERLIAAGHEVLLHARDKQKAAVLGHRLPEAMGVVAGDLSSIEETERLACQVNAFGVFDCVIHNAGVGYREARTCTAEGFPQVFAINSLAPYILTCLIRKPRRLIYTSSGLHQQGDASLSDMLWQRKPWNSLQAYSDTKLQNVLLAFAVARHWPDVYCNVVSPGWVATKMGGPYAPGDLNKAPETQVWLASSDEAEAQVSGRFFYHKRPCSYLEESNDIRIQDEFIRRCEWLSGLELPEVSRDNFSIFTYQYQDGDYSKNQVYY